MFRSEPLEAGNGPKAILLNATPDPLGSLAALYGIYTGKVKRSLSEVTGEERREAFEDQFKTELQGPLEAITFHFLIEGVTRAWTHQAVRERHAFFAQESLRFAVVDGDDWNKRARPAPSIAGSGHQLIWERAMDDAQAYYNELIEAGVPAEDARGVMPHDMTTRLHLVCNLRTLLHLAGLRLCTQAQFEWRAVMAQIVLAIREYNTDRHYANALHGHGLDVYDDNWQFALIADKLRPVCYQKGQCGFMAKFDRGCTIRSRVDANAKAGRPSSEWHLRLVRDFSSGNFVDPMAQPDIEAINPSEWAADPTAARRGE